MIAVNIVGFKKSGKTTCVALLAEQIERLGKRVAIVKYTHHGLDKPSCDTTWLTKENRTIVGIGEEESVVWFTERKPLHDCLPFFDADVLLIEGGKQLTYLPRVICLRSPEEINELTPSLALATYGENSVASIPHFNSEDIEKLAQYVIDKGFLLPGLNCKACGYDSCQGLAEAIKNGEKTIADCVTQESTMEVLVNGKALALNPFVARIIQGSIEGMLSSLKGFTPQSEITIRFKGH